MVIYRTIIAIKLVLISAKAADNASPTNEQNTFAVGVSSNKFIADLTAPTNLKFTILI